MEGESMKKSVLLAVFAFITEAAFAQFPEFKPSAGVGGFYTLGFGGGSEIRIVVRGDGIINTENPVTTGLGGFAFLDLTFARLGVAFGGGRTTTTHEVTILDQSAGDSPGAPPHEATTTFSALDLSLLAKYPFPLGAFTLFPLLGIDYRLVLSVKNEAGVELDKPGDYSSLWFQGGAGLDFALTRVLYLRCELLYGLRLPTKHESDTKEAATGSGQNAKNPLGHGPNAKIALGFIF
jgi:opacity protein-like surface antigen